MGLVGTDGWQECLPLGRRGISSCNIFWYPEQGGSRSSSGRQGEAGLGAGDTGRGRVLGRLCLSCDPGWPLYRFSLLNKCLTAHPALELLLTSLLVPDGPPQEFFQRISPKLESRVDRGGPGSGRLVCVPTPPPLPAAGCRPSLSVCLPPQLSLALFWKVLSRHSGMF